jgi:hypothetical protein
MTSAAWARRIMLWAATIPVAALPKKERRVSLVCMISFLLF